MLRLPLKTELDAARAVAARAGLGSVTPEVLRLGNHTTVRLAPWPVVARIASGTSFDFSDAGLERELVVARHLASRGAPAVRPAAGVPPGPYREASCAITLWAFVDGREVAGEADEMLAAAALREVHAGLVDIDIELPSFVTKVESCDAILSDPAQAPALAADDRLFFERLYADLRARIEGVSAGWPPLHGDTHMGNVLIGSAGAVWMDLEAACIGPVEWDVVNLPAATRRQFDGLDPAVMELFADVRSLCVAVWCWAEFDRGAATAEAAVHHLALLKARFA